MIRKRSLGLFWYFFFGNNKLKRIFTDYGFEGHPFKIDFPVTGFLELYFDDNINQIIYDEIILSQEYIEYS